MLLHKGFTHIQSQIKPWLLFGESFTLSKYLKKNFCCSQPCAVVIMSSILFTLASWKKGFLRNQRPGFSLGLQTEPLLKNTSSLMWDNPHSEMNFFMLSAICSVLILDGLSHDILRADCFPLRFISTMVHPCIWCFVSYWLEEWWWFWSGDRAGRYPRYWYHQ